MSLVLFYYTVCPIKNAHDKKIHEKIRSEISALPMATLNSVEKERFFNAGPAMKRARYSQNDVLARRACVSCFDVFFNQQKFERNVYGV